MKWTKEKPTEPGFYWVRSVVDGEIEEELVKIVRETVRESEDFLVAEAERYACCAEDFDEYWGPLPAPGDGEDCALD